MPLPRWLAKTNRRLFNKRELERGVRPVLTHVGRTSGKPYQTPLDAHPVENGYIFVMVYGSGSDWVKNVLAAGSARLTVEGQDVDLVEPRIVSKDVASAQLPSTTKLRATEYLQMDIRS